MMPGLKKLVLTMVMLLANSRGAIVIFVCEDDDEAALRKIVNLVLFLGSSANKDVYRCRYAPSYDNDCASCLVVAHGYVRTSQR